MSTIVWEEFLNIPVASDEEIQQVENQLGMTFPEEFKQVLKSAQGKVPVPEVIECGESRNVPFGPIFHVLSGERSSYSIKQMKESWSHCYPNLLPIADSGDGCIFAYDFSKDKNNPPVVFVDADADPDDEGLLFVTHSLTELLANLREAKS